MASRPQRLLVVALTTLSCILLAPAATAAPGNGRGAPPFPIEIDQGYEGGWPCDFPMTERVVGKFGGAYTPRWDILTAPGLTAVFTNDDSEASVRLSITGPILETFEETEDGRLLVHDRFKGRSVLFEPPSSLGAGMPHTLFVGPADVTFELHEGFDPDGAGPMPEEDYWFHIIEIRPGKGTKVVPVCSLID